MSVLPELRRAVVSDLEAMAEAERRCFPDPWSFRLLSDLLSSSYDSVFVLASEDTLLGYVNVRVLGDEAELMRSFRRRGESATGLHCFARDLLKCARGGRRRPRLR